MYKFAKKVANHEGFTLVELIVVIAILGILAGIAIPVYSGYIKKANQAADNTLLAAVNTAFGAAALENGVDAVKVLDATLSYASDENGNAVISGLSTAALPAGCEATSADVAESFAKYFAGNEGTLKYFEKGDVFFYEGVFTTDSSAAMTKAIANYQNSNFNGHEEALLQSVEGITNVFGDWIGNESDPISDRMNSLSAIGLDADAQAAFINKYGLTDTSTNTAIANALVLEVASRSKNVDPYSVYSAISTSGPSALLSGDRMTNLPLAYGLLTAYANSEYASDAFKTYYNSATLSAGLSNDGDNTDSLVTLFQKFSAEDSTKTNSYFANDALDDMNGYLGAMTAIAQNASEVDINAEHAINNSAILALVRSFLGGE